MPQSISATSLSFSVSFYPNSSKNWVELGLTATTKLGLYSDLVQDRVGNESNVWQVIKDPLSLSMSNGELRIAIDVNIASLPIN